MKVGIVKNSTSDPAVARKLEPLSENNCALGRDIRNLFYVSAGYGSIFTYCGGEKCSMTIL